MSEADLLIVVMQEQAQADVVHRVHLRERERFSDKAGHALTQNIVEPLHMARLTVAFVGRPVLLVWQHFGISPPEVRVEQARLVSLWNAPPQQSAGDWLFFNHVLTVLRETPKMRFSPRREGRSW